jgi:pilus assembly protein Flp/PilA
MIRIAAQLRSREDGQAMVEYALILGLVSVATIVALTLIGTDVNVIFGRITGALESVPAAA